MLIPKPFAAMVSTRSDEVARDISFIKGSFDSSFPSVSLFTISSELKKHGTVLNRLQRDETATKRENDDREASAMTVGVMITLIKIE